MKVATGSIYFKSLPEHEVKMASAEFEEVEVKP